MARLIVERSTIMNSLFSKHSCRPESDPTLTALISIFSTYVCRMRKTKEGEDLYSWVSTLKFKIVMHFSKNSTLVLLCYLHCLISLCWILQSESQDQVFLRWTTGETATMHILVVHAMVILLTLGPPKGTLLLHYFFLN